VNRVAALYSSLRLSGYFFDLERRSREPVRRERRDATMMVLMASMKASSAQRELFGDSSFPSGFVYQTDFLTPAEEQTLLARIQELPLRHSQYRMFTAKRRIVSFGAGYDFASQRPTPAPPVPAFLHTVRERAAARAGIAAADLTQCTIAEYSPGTQLGWHRDVPTFGVVIGLSLAAACRMRLRPYPHVKHRRQPARVFVLEPRSIYVFRDAARWRWQHAISPTKALRYSITFRTMRNASAGDRPNELIAAAPFARPS